MGFVSQLPGNMKNVLMVVQVRIREQDYELTFKTGQYNLVP